MGSRSDEPRFVREALRKAKRLVVKIGSRVLRGEAERGVDPARIEVLAGEIAELRSEGREAVVVTSGAIACGVARLGLGRRPKDLPRLQAAAAAGQIGLMHLYESAFARRRLVAAQVLLTHGDMSDRRRYLNARATLRALLDFGAVPVVNENDTIATSEIRFGDNDNLSAEIAGLLEADLLVLLTDVEGLFDADPRRHPAARRIALIRDIAREADPFAGDSGPGGVGTGGMKTKIEAARRSARSGIPTLIADGHRHDAVTAALRGEELGTLFVPDSTPLPSRKRWIAQTLKPRGRVVVDPGAAAAIVERGKSLLPAGVKSVSGHFHRGDAVSVETAGGREIARGLANFDREELVRIAGRSTGEARAILGPVDEEVIHRDHLVVLKQAGGAHGG